MYKTSEVSEPRTQASVKLVMTACVAVTERKKMRQLVQIVFQAAGFLECLEFSNCEIIYRH